MLMSLGHLSASGSNPQAHVPVRGFRDQPPTALLQTLRIGSTGQAVTLVHACLLHLRYGAREKSLAAAVSITEDSLPIDEIANAVFGPGTRQIIINVQTAFQKLLHVEPNGVWDRDLAAVVYTELVTSGISLSKPPQFFVAGKVLYADGPPAVNQVVEVVDRDLNAETTLARIESNGQGGFFVRFLRSQVSRSGEREPALAIRVIKAKDAVYETPLDQVVFNAMSLTLFNIKLAQKSPNTPGTDEFSQTVASLDTILPPLKTDPKKPSVSAAAVESPKPPRSNIAQRIANLRDDSKVSDLKYLDLMGSLKVSSSTLTKLVLSFRLSLFSSSNLKISAPPELFYALLATNAQQSFSPNDPSNLGLVDMSLQAQTEPLLYQLSLLDSSVIQKSVNTAKNTGLVPQSSLSPADLAKIVAQLRAAANKWIIKQPTLEDRIWALVWTFLTGGGAKGLLDTMATENVQGDLIGFMIQLMRALNGSSSQSLMMAASATGVTSTSTGTGDVHTPATSSTSRVAMDNPQTEPARAIPGPDELLTSIASSHFKSRRDVAGVGAEAISEAVGHALGQHVDSAQVAASTAAIMLRLEQEFPAQAFTSRLREHVNASPSSGSTTSDASGTKAKSATEASASQLLGSGKAQIDAALVLGFLDNNPDFDLAKGNLHALGKCLDADENRRHPHVKLIQRIFRLAPSFSSTKALLEMGHDSA
jgi:hypothetical protein